MSSRQIHRREFIRRSSLGLASVAVAGKMPCPDTPVPASPAGEIIRRPLGRTGTPLPIVSMGVMNADNPAIMKAAYELGIRHFDTAWRYQSGRNEQMVGQVIREMNIRQSITLATKVPLALGNRSSYTLPDLEELRKTHGADLEKVLHRDYLDTFAESLSRLQQDYVDILYVHSVKDPGTVELPFLQDALGQLKKEGKVRFLGISTHQSVLEIIERTVKTGFYDIILAPLNYKASIREEIAAALKKARAAGLGVVAMKTQAVYDNSRDTHHTAALKYVLRHEFVDTAIPGFTTFDQLEEDFSVARNLEYNVEESRYLEDFRKNSQARIRPCERCERCLATCPRGVDIPDLMRTYMYTAGYHNFEHARLTYRGIPVSRNLRACDDCTRCSATCANGLNIAANLRQLRSLFHDA
jgi:predicted aldo/keto reductase-like oxidoreductase